MGECSPEIRMRNAFTWPGLRDGGLTLPLPGDWFTPPVAELAVGVADLGLKSELHVTLLDRDWGSQIEEALGASQIQKIFEGADWAIGHTGNGALLRKHKADDHSDRVCWSLIELVDLPAMRRFRISLAAATGIKVPSAPPHVTLYTAVDPKGIGVPSDESLNEMVVAKLRLPGIANRPPPRLDDGQRAAYEAANYHLDAIEAKVQIGESCRRVDAELARRQVTRATIVTAYNPFSSQDEDLANTTRQQWLLGYVQRESLAFEQAEGADASDHWHGEPSLLVFGTTPDIDDRLMRDFEQHAVVVLELGAPARLSFHPDAS